MKLSLVTGAWLPGFTPFQQLQLSGLQQILHNALCLSGTSAFSISSGRESLPLFCSFSVSPWTSAWNFFASPLLPSHFFWSVRTKIHSVGPRAGVISPSLSLTRSFQPTQSSPFLKECNWTWQQTHRIDRLPQMAKLMKCENHSQYVQIFHYTFSTARKCTSQTTQNPIFLFSF